jgi:hypothetical protein
MVIKKRRTFMEIKAIVTLAVLKIDPLIFLAKQGILSYHNPNPSSTQKKGKCLPLHLPKT